MSETKPIVRELYIDHSPSWGIWPKSGSCRDVDSFISKTVEYETDHHIVRRTQWPAYTGWIRAGLTPPTSYYDSGIDNTVAVPDAVTAAMVFELQRLFAQADIVQWNHAECCYPSVADKLKGACAVTVLRFGDDCPHRTPLATLPVASLFNHVICLMRVFDYDTGRTTEDVYHAAGIANWHLGLLGPSSFVGEHVAKHGCMKAEDVIADYQCRWTGLGRIPFVAASAFGFGNDRRVAFYTALNSRAGDVEAALGGKICLHGWSGMRDGFIDGQMLFDKYRASTASINFPQSSALNSRLFDLCLLGIPQLVPDRHNELSYVGMTAGEHFLQFDGTLDGMLGVLKQQNVNSLAAIAAASSAWAQRTLPAKNSHKVWCDLVDSVLP